MARSQILPAAERDLVDLFAARLDYSDAAATRFADLVAEAVGRLETWPESGPLHPDLGGGIRVLHLNRVRATLYYVVTDDEETVVTVLRVLRQERDPDAGDLRP